MPRPRLGRRIKVDPRALYFKPRGIPLRFLEEIDLTLEELEALNLKHVKKLDQIAAAAKMKTSQSTFQRILASAQRKTADALVNGKAIKISPID